MAFDGLWWFMKNYHGLWKNMMVYEELWWFMKNMMVYEELWWFMMAYDGLSWFMGLEISFCNTPNPVNPWFFSSEIEKLKPWVFTFNTSPWYGGFHKWWMVYHGKSHKMDENYWELGVPPWLRKPPLSVVSSLILVIWWGKTLDYHGDIIGLPSSKLTVRPWFYHPFLMETNLPTPMNARLELLIYQRVSP